MKITVVEIGYVDLSCVTLLSKKSKVAMFNANVTNRFDDKINDMKHKIFIYDLKGLY